MYHCKACKPTGRSRERPLDLQLSPAYSPDHRRATEGGAPILAAATTQQAMTTQLRKPIPGMSCGAPRIDANTLRNGWSTIEIWRDWMATQRTCAECAGDSVARLIAGSRTPASAVTVGEGELMKQTIGNY